MKTFISSVCLLACATGLVVPNISNAEYKVLGKKIMDDIRAKEEASRVKEVYEYDRDAYAPKGAKVGGFKVDATADATVTFDDNIYASDTNEKSDIIVTLKPEIAVNSDWNRHKLTAVAYVERKEFVDNHKEETTDYGARARMRVDVTRNSYATLGGNYALRHEGRDDPNANTVASKPTEYTEMDATVGYTHAVGKASLAGRIDYTNYDYEDGETTAGANIDNDIRDRDDINYVAEVGYAVIPGTKAFVRGTMTDVEYDQAAAGRDNDGYSVVVGAKGDLSGTIRAEGYAGFMRRDYDNASLASINDATYGGNVVWSATPLTSVKAKMDRSIEETTAANASGILQTTTGVEVQHELKRNILWGGNLNFVNNEYEGISREDDVTKAGIDVKYLLNRRLSVGAGYNFSNRDSNVSGNNYDANALMFSLTGAL